MPERPNFPNGPDAYGWPAMKRERVPKKRRLKKLPPSFVKNFIGARWLGRWQPLWIDLRVTNRCNLHCLYCDLPDQHLRDMSLDEIKTVLDKIPTRSWIMVTGGEPLVRQDTGRIIDHIVFQTPHYVTLNTNLLWLKERYEEVKYCDGFYFSLDGPQATHEKTKGRGIWEKVIQSLELLHREKRGKTSMTVITRDTSLEDIRAVLQMAAAYDFTPTFQLVTHYSRSGLSRSFPPERENASRILDYLIDQKKKGVWIRNSLKGLMAQKKILEDDFRPLCFSGRLYCTIDSDGTVGLCFARPRDDRFLRLNDPNVDFQAALRALRDVKPRTARCEVGCQCICQIEFGLTGLWDPRDLLQVDQGFSRYLALENRYTKKLNSAAGDRRPAGS